MRTYAATATFSAFVSDTMAKNLLKDDRFLKFANKHWKQLREDADFVLQIPVPMWGWVAEVCGGAYEEGQSFRGKVVWSILATMGYLHWDAFDQLSYPPLSLTQGDLHANVEKIEVTPFEQLDDEVSQISVHVDAKIQDRVTEVSSP